MNKILVIGDTHFKDYLSYSDYIDGGREKEKENVLNFIIEQSKDCDHIVFLGDFFNAKNNSSNVNKQAVSFLEKFENDIYMISGNHTKKGDGSTAIDFIKEIKDKRWNIYTKPTSVMIGDKKVSFLPYMLNSELEVTNFEDSAKNIVKDLEDGDILFAHHAISGTMCNGLGVEMFHEAVLSKEELEKKFKLVVAGHIHDPQEIDKTVITGSVFTDSVGEIEKFIWKIKSDLTVEKIKLPNREIHKLENPTIEELTGIDKSSIVKVMITDKKIKVEELKKKLKDFDATLLIENYPNKRKKAHIEEGAFDFSIEALLKLYAKEKKIDYQKLLKGLQIIND